MLLSLTSLQVHMAYLNGYAIKHLILHGLPWVNVEALQRIVPEMPKLEALGVHQCFLLTLGDTQPLLQHINGINQERVQLKQPHIAVDFSPYYYKGPPYKEDGSGHVGEYGVVPEELKWLATTRAVVAQLFAIWGLCHKGNQDFFTAGTGFRSYLNRLPIRTLPSILECIAAIYDYKAGKYHSGIGIHPRYKTGTYYKDGYNNAPLISEDMKHAMEYTLWTRLMVSCEGKPMLREDVDKLLLARRRIHLDHCTICSTDIAAYFFMAEGLHCRVEDVRCYGCDLQTYLSGHIYRLYCLRREVAQHIFRSKNHNHKELSLCRVLKNISKPAQPEVKAGFGRKARPAKDAVLSLPGMVDTRFLNAAERLRDELTIKMPDEVREITRAIAIIDERYDNPLYIKNKTQLSERKETLGRKRMLLEVQLGTGQRCLYEGSLERNCRSWELNIRDYRAELAIEKGLFKNYGPMHIYNYESNVAEMLGASGGLPEYWDVHFNAWFDEKGFTADMHSAEGADDEKGSTADMHSAEGDDDEKGSTADMHSAAPSTPNPSAVDNSTENPSSTANISSRQTPRPSGMYIPPHKRATEVAANPVLLPHQRRPAATIAQPNYQPAPAQRKLYVNIATEVPSATTSRKD